MIKLCAKIILKVLSEEHKQRCDAACWQDWLEDEGDLNFLQRIVIGDESWIYEYNSEIKGKGRTLRFTFKWKF